MKALVRLLGRVEEIMPDRWHRLYQLTGDFRECLARVAYDR